LACDLWQELHFARPSKSATAALEKIAAASRVSMYMSGCFILPPCAFLIQVLMARIVRYRDFV